MDTAAHSSTSDLGSQSKTPIAALPPEILLEIFTSVVEKPKWGVPSSHRCIPLAQVCRFWREVALSAPNLWSKIRNAKLPWAIAMLEHSQIAPLTVEIWGQDSCELIEPIFKHLARIEKLEISSWDSKNWEAMQLCIETNACTAPLLRSIKLDGRDKEPIWSFPATMFQHAGLLQDLHLKDISLDWKNLPNLPNLTEMRLEITRYQDTPTWSNLTSVFERMPALKYLALEGAIRDTTVWPNSGAVAHLPCLERVELCRCAVEAAAIFLNRFGLSKDLKLFTIKDVYSFPERDALRHFFNNARSALPDFISRVKCLDIRLDWISTELEDRNHKVYIEGFTTLRQGFYNEDFYYYGSRDNKQANLKLEFNYTRQISPYIILENALEILPFQHVTHLRLNRHLNYPELRAMLATLPELEAIIVLAKAAAHLVEALLDLQRQLDDTQTTVAGGCLALPMLAHIGIHSDETGIDGKIGWQRCVYGQTWAQLQEFLELRKARNAEMHRLEIKRCRFVDREAVEGLQSCARHVEWDGMCRDVHIKAAFGYPQLAALLARLVQAAISD